MYPFDFFYLLYQRSRKLYKRVLIKPVQRTDYITSKINLYSHTILLTFGSHTVKTTCRHTIKRDLIVLIKIKRSNPKILLSLSYVINYFKSILSYR